MAESFRGTPQEMLTVSTTIVKNMKDYFPNFQLAMSIYTPEYQTATLAKIKEVSDTLLGKYKFADQVSKSELLYALLPQVKTNVNILKNFVNRVISSTTLKKLGFTKKLKEGLSNEDQEDIFSLLSAINNNLTDQMQTDFIAKGLNPQILAEIGRLATDFEAANTDQESAKGSTKLYTEESKQEFLKIYNEIILISVFAPDVLENKADARRLFGYNYLLDQLSGGSNNTDKIDDTEEE